MTNRPRDIGTKTETAVVRTLTTRGFPHAERRTLKGNLDQGDITGTPGICWEVKGGDAARNASDGLIADWLEETATEARNSRADLGILVVQRRAIGHTNAHKWWAITTADRLNWLLSRKVTTHGVAYDIPVRLHLGDMCDLLRAAGYGEPLPEPEVTA